MLPTIPQAAETMPAPTILPPVAPPRRRALYLVGEAERSTPKPVATEGRTMISINGRWTALRGRVVTYTQLLRFVYPDREGQDPGIATVSYRHPDTDRRAGLLTPGDAIPLTDGLLFNVNATFAS